MPPAPDVDALLLRLKAALRESRVRFSWKAEDEIADLGWTEEDARGELAALAPSDLLRTEPSRSAEFTLIWVFCPLAAELERYLWIRVSEDAAGSLIISFHLAERDPWT